MHRQGLGGYPKPPSTTPGSPPVTSTNTADPASSAPPTTTTAPGGGDFDYQSNPYYQQVLAAVNAGGLADAANTRAAIQQALVGFGFVPGGFKDKLGALDATTRALIQKNTDTGISGYARLLEGRSEGIKGLVNRLQARGLRRSGAKGYGLRKNQLDFDRNFADAVANLLGQTGGMYSQYAQNEAARQQQLANAMAWVYQNYYTGQGTSRSGGDVTGSSTSPSGQRTRNVGSSYDNPEGTLYDFGGGWWGF